MWAERPPSPRPISGEQSPSSDSWGPRIPSRVSAAPGEANSEDGGVWGAKGTAPDGAGFTLARPSLPGFAGALPDSGSSPGSLGDTGRRAEEGHVTGGGRRAGRRRNPKKRVSAGGDPGGGEKVVDSESQPPGPYPPLPAFSRSAPPRRGLATSSSDVSRRRHIGKAPPPPPPLLPPPPPRPSRSSGSPWAAIAGRKEPLARPDDRPACFAPARLPMTAPGPATDGRRPSARV